MVLYIRSSVLALAIEKGSIWSTKKRDLLYFLSSFSRHAVRTSTCTYVAAVAPTEISSVAVHVEPP